MQGAVANPLPKARVVPQHLFGFAVDSLSTLRVCAVSVARNLVEDEVLSVPVPFAVLVANGIEHSSSHERESWHSCFNALVTASAVHAVLAFSTAVVAVGVILCQYHSQGTSALYVIISRKICLITSTVHPLPSAL